MTIGQYDASIFVRVLGSSTAWSDIDDIESLPVQLWKQAHYSKYPPAGVLQRKNILLRDAAYVFWDGRIGDIKDVQEKIESIEWTFNGRLFPHEIPSMIYAMHRSWKSRRAIWLNGGSGYWSGDNTCAVV